MRHVPLQRRPITPRMLHDLCAACDRAATPLTASIKVAILFGFCGFLRQSNLAPRTASGFDPTRHTCRGDVLLQPPGLVIVLKWSKTMQAAGPASLLPIPTVKIQAIDPVQAYRDMLSLVPTNNPNDPLLLLPTATHNRIPITVSILRQAFHELLVIIGVDPALYSLHSLRRGGATAAFHKGASLMDIQRHGTWTSQAFMHYITANHHSDSKVAMNLASALSQ